MRQLLRQAAPALTCLGLVLLSVAIPVMACQAEPESGGKCFAVRGRVFSSNGTPSMRIAPIGSHRVFGVLPAENEDAPDSIRGGVTFDRSATADLDICPLTRAKAGEMQMVCIRSASNITFKSP
jgi:hypothetical protein